MVLLIAGIDPGTTVGYAYLNLEGKVVCIGSKRGINLNELVALTTQIGRVVVTGTDKLPIPKFVERYARSFRCHVYKPREDLSIADKKLLAKGIKTKNDHEMDALASAKNAYKKTKSVIDKVKNYVKKHDIQQLQDQIMILVIGRNDISIKLAHDILTAKTTESRLVKKAVEQRSYTEKDYLILFDRLKSMKLDNDMLKKQNTKFLKLNTKLSKKKPGKKTDSDEVVYRKDSTIRKLDKHIKGINKRISVYSRRLAKIEQNLSEGKVVVKRLKNLGWVDFKISNKILKIKEGDILLVDNPSVISEKTIEYLRNKIQILIVKNKPSGKLVKKFAIIRANDIKLYEEQNFGFVDKSDLDRHVIKKEMINTIIQDYQKNR